MFGTTDRSGAARKAPHANTRNPGALNTASRKRHRDGAAMCDGPVGILKRDVTRRTEPVPSPYPLEVLIAARQRGVSVKTYLALAKLDNHLKGK